MKLEQLKDLLTAAIPRGCMCGRTETCETCSPSKATRFLKAYGMKLIAVAEAAKMLSHDHTDTFAFHCRVLSTGEPQDCDCPLRAYYKALAALESD